MNEHPRRDMDVILRQFKAPIERIIDRGHRRIHVPNDRLWWNLCVGPFFVTSEHPRRAVDVILRQSKGVIEIFNSRSVLWLNSCSKYSFMTKQLIFFDFQKTNIVSPFLLEFWEALGALSGSQEAAYEQTQFLKYICWYVRVFRFLRTINNGKTTWKKKKKT